MSQNRLTFIVGIGLISTFIYYFNTFHSGQSPNQPPIIILIGGILLVFLAAFDPGKLKVFIITFFGKLVSFQGQRQEIQEDTNSLRSQRDKIESKQIKLEKSKDKIAK